MYAITTVLSSLSPQGNKGAVAVHFNLYHSSLCFVNGHLPAHAEELEKRNQVRLSSLPPQGVEEAVSMFLFLFRTTTPS